MKTEIGIIETNRIEVAKQLTILLADEYVLYTKTRNAHWNIEGPDFFEKHTFFDSQSALLDSIIDRVAERSRALGCYSYATLKSFLELTHLTESKQDKNDSQTFLKELLTDHECIIIFLRENIHAFSKEYHDLGSSDFITGLMEEHEKMAWFIRSHIQI